MRTASQISLNDQHFGETKHVEVFPQQKNFHKFLRTKSTHSKERKYKRRNLPQLAHLPIKGTRKLGGSGFSIIDSENEGNMPVFPNFPQVLKLRKSISGSGKQSRSESLSYIENPEYPQKFISNIATLVSTSWSWKFIIFHKMFNFIIWSVMAILIKFSFNIIMIDHWSFRSLTIYWFSQRKITASCKVCHRCEYWIYKFLDIPILDGETYICACDVCCVAEVLSVWRIVCK